MSITELFQKLVLFIRPYRSLIVYTLLLTIVGSFAEQVNAFILKYTVDSIEGLLTTDSPLANGVSLLLKILHLLQT